MAIATEILEQAGGPLVLGFYVLSAVSHKLRHIVKHTES